MTPLSGVLVATLEDAKREHLSHLNLTLEEELGPDATISELRRAYPLVKAAVFQALDPAEVVVMQVALDDGLELLSEYSPVLPAVVLVSASLRAIIVLYDVLNLRF